MLDRIDRIVAICRQEPYPYFTIARTYSWRTWMSPVTLPEH